MRWKQSTRYSEIPRSERRGEGHEHPGEEHNIPQFSRRTKSSCTKNNGKCLLCVQCKVMRAMSRYPRSCKHLFHQFDSIQIAKFAWVLKSSQTWVSDMFSGGLAVWCTLILRVLILHGPFKRSVHSPPSSHASKFSIAELLLSSELVGGRSWCMWSKSQMILRVFAFSSCQYCAPMVSLPPSPTAGESCGEGL